MKRFLALSCLIALPVAHAETAPAPAVTRPATTAPARPAAPAPATTATKPPAAPAPATATPRPAAPSLVAQAPNAQAVPLVPKAPAPAAVPTPPAAGATAAPAPAVPSVPPPLTPEQRRQLELLANAERIDKANRELLARNQELQLQNENLGMQLNIIRHDKSSDGIWKGALAVIAGFLMGWFFATSSHRKSSW